MSTSIPALHISDKSRATGDGDVFIQTRQDAASSGTFHVRLDVSFDPAVQEYPVGNVFIKADLSDGAKGTFNSTSIELINSHGKHNPTVILTGRCSDQTQPDAKGCRYWLLIANNKNPAQPQGTPDIVSLVINDRNGKRVTYGTGPVRAGDFNVQPAD